MAISVEAYGRMLQALLPAGPAWNVDSDSELTKVLLGIAAELARVAARGQALLEESDPRTTLELLEDWERAFGLPDLCVAIDDSVATRRAALAAKVASIGGQSPAYFIAVAAAYGFPITITEFAPSDVEDDVDAPIVDDAWAYVWQVTAPLAAAGEFTVEDGVDDPLAWWGSDVLECVLQRLKPAHTSIIFSYS